MVDRFVPLALGLVLLSLGAVEALANLGASPEEALEKYGRETGSLTPIRGTDEARQYTDGQQLYNVHFKDDEAVMIQVAGNRRPMSFGDAVRTLDNHRNGSRWIKVASLEPLWMTQDGRAKAEFAPQSAQLFIYDSDWQMTQAGGQDREKEIAGKETDPGPENQGGSRSPSSRAASNIRSGGETKSNTVIVNP